MFVHFVFDTVMQHVVNGNGGILFLDAPGATKRTFIINLLLAEIRKDNNSIGLAIVSSGIAATLLPGWRTVHSTLKLSLDLATSDSPICNITKNSGKEKLLKSCKTII